MVLAEDVSVEEGSFRDRPREPSTQRRLADTGRAGDDQQGRSCEGALIRAVRASQDVPDRWDQIGAASARLARKRHMTIIAPTRPNRRQRARQDPWLPR